MTSPVVAALDTADLDELRQLAATLAPEIGYAKVGLEAFTAHGAAAVQAAAAHVPVFLDAKLHDIPATVRGAAAAAARLDVALLTVHASGGSAMVAAAKEAAPRVAILAVTVLTSLDDRTLRAVGQPPAAEQVPRLAELAVDAGADGVVCAPTDVAAVRAAVGPDALLVVPGVRPADAQTHDQARTGTPEAAIAAGADLVVVGRPITRDPDPAAAARRIRRACEQDR